MADISIMEVFIRISSQAKENINQSSLLMCIKGNSKKVFLSVTNIMT